MVKFYFCFISSNFPLSTFFLQSHQEVIHHNHITLVSNVPMFKGMNPILLVELLEVLVFEMFETDKGAVKVETDRVILLLTDESFGGEWRNPAVVHFLVREMLITCS